MQQQAASREGVTRSTSPPHSQHNQDASSRDIRPPVTQAGRRWACADQGAIPQVSVIMGTQNKDDKSQDKSQQGRQPQQQQQQADAQKTKQPQDKPQQGSKQQR